MSEVVDALDLKARVTREGGVPRGVVPSHPRMRVTVRCAADAVGIPASRQMARERDEHIAFRVLAANQRPDVRTIRAVRQPHLAARTDRFVQGLTRCQRAGLVTLGHGALEGTTVQAHASKHTARSDERMVPEETRRQAEVDTLLRAAATADLHEDARDGLNRRGDARPTEWARRALRRQTSRAAKAVWEQEAHAEAALKQAAQEARDAAGPRRGPVPHPPSPVPNPKAQRNVTDPERRIMPASGATGRVVPGDHCQAVVEATAQIILAADGTDEPNATQHAPPRFFPGRGEHRPGASDREPGCGLLQRRDCRGRGRAGG